MGLGIAIDFVGGSIGTPVGAKLPEAIRHTAMPAIGIVTLLVRHSDKRLPGERARSRNLLWAARWNWSSSRGAAQSALTATSRRSTGELSSCRSKSTAHPAQPLFYPWGAVIQLSEERDGEGGTYSVP